MPAIQIIIETKRFFLTGCGQLPVLPSDKQSLMLIQETIGQFAYQIYLSAPKKILLELNTFLTNLAYKIEKS